MVDLLQEYTGELRVIIEGVGEFTLNFDPKIIGEVPTLFDYVGQAYACLVTDFKNPTIETKPSEWEVIEFLPDQRILKVKKIGGEQIRSQIVGKHIIQIVSIPEGPGIPEKIRRGWIGACFEAEGPVEMEVSSVLDPNEYHGLRWVYIVPSDLALAVLKYRNRESWEWFNNQPRLAPIFCFNAEACKVLV